MFAGDLGRYLILLAIGLFGVSLLTWIGKGLKSAAPTVIGGSVLLAVYGLVAGLSTAGGFYYDSGFTVGWVVTVVGLIGALWWARSAQRVPALAFTLGVVSLFGAMLCLGSLFIGNQFEYEYVFARAELSTEIKYKIAGIWSGQQGSFLLWACMSGIFGILGARVAGEYRRWYTICFAGFLLVLSAILAYESPFTIDPEAWRVAKEAAAQGIFPSAALPFLPPDGRGLEPSLQNYWVVIHPPTIFAGFGALTLLFCFSMAAMLRRNATEWVAIVRPWALVTLAVLGLGLCMGGFWAYETLGWGGFWAWDPVENVSFVPWCFVAALVHGLIVQTTRKRWTISNLLLAGLPFLLFVYGTFMTRSGFLEDQSVHSFAEMNRTALWLLVGLLGVATLAFFGTWIFRGLKLAAEEPDVHVTGVHREGAYRWGALFLSALGIATAVGMSVPLIQSMVGGAPKRVEEQSYHFILVWFFLPIMLLVAAGPFIAWRGMKLGELLNRLVTTFSIALFVTGVLFFVGRQSDWAASWDPATTVAFPFGIHFPTYHWVVLLTVLCAFAVVANLWRLAELWKRSRSSTGAFLSHIGVAVLMAGLIISRGLEQKSDLLLVGESRAAKGLGYLVTYKGRKFDAPLARQTLQDPNATPADRDKAIGELEHALFRRDNELVFQVDGPHESFEARPGHFFLPRLNENQEPAQMNWPYIHHGLWHDLYFTVRGEIRSAGQPITIAPQQTVEELGLRLTYQGMRMEGAPGQKGTKFIAKVIVADDQGRQVTAEPFMQMADDGMLQPKVQLDGNLSIMLMRIDPETNSAIVQLVYNEPVYPVEIFYKPMTILVWTGTGILTLGGLLSAWYRRRPRTIAAIPEESIVDDVLITENAPEATA
jgi:cytochrome c-type biogenesis protein CcmF